MEFGRITLDEAGDIDFVLPKDPGENEQVFSNLKVRNQKVWFGLPKWGRTEWVGKLYPERTKEKDFLSHYVHLYNSIELNATHYKIMGARGMKKWADKANGIKFRFCPKVYQGITHKGSLKGKEFISNEFFRGIAGFGEHLGGIFLQVSENFSPRRLRELCTYIESLPKEMQFFLELRHHGWFDKKDERAELVSFLREHNIGLVITDVPGRRDVLHMQLSIPKTMIRLCLFGEHQSDRKRIDDWVERIKYWLQTGLEEAYLFIHVYEMSMYPELSKYMAEQLNSKCDLNLPEIKLLK